MHKSKEHDEELVIKLSDLHFKREKHLYTPEANERRARENKRAHDLTMQLAQRIKEHTMKPDTSEKCLEALENTNWDEVEAIEPEPVYNWQVWIQYKNGSAELMGTWKYQEEAEDQEHELQQDKDVTRVWIEEVII